MDKLEVDNKKTFVKKGVTEDIVDAVIACYDRNIDNVPDSLLRLVRSSDRYECAYNIWSWVASNIRYKKDPEGEQWIKTPSRLIYDGCGDCKSMTILICAVLTKLGIKNKFRFVSYDKTRNYTHVYPVAVIEGEDIPLDAVAYIQRGTDFGNEIKYNYKKDHMNKTVISELSGVSRMNGAVSKLNDNMSAAKLVCESYKLIAIATADAPMWDKWNILSLLVDKYQEDTTLFRVAAYAWLTKLNFSSAPDLLSNGAIRSYIAEVDKFVASSNKSSFAISNDVLSNPAFSANWDIVEYQIIPVLDRYKPDCNNVLVGNDLMGMGIAGLYLFFPDAVLTKSQRSKKRNQETIVNKMIGTSLFTPLAALNYIYAGFVSMLHTTPLYCFNAMFGKSLHCEYITEAISGEQIIAISGDDDECYNIEYNPNIGSFEGVQKAEVVKDNTTIYDNIGDWITKATGWFKDIYGAITGGGSSNGNGVIPTFNDASGSGFGWVILGLFGIGGILLLRKKGKRK